MGALFSFYPDAQGKGLFVRAPLRVALPILCHMLLIGKYARRLSRRACQKQGRFQIQKRVGTAL